MDRPEGLSLLLSADFFGGFINDLAAGMNVISSTRALNMPNAVKRPKDWKVFSWKVSSDAKLAAATRPAVIMTGPIFVRDSRTACFEASALQWLASAPPPCPSPARGDGTFAPPPLTGEGRGGGGFPS